MTGFKSGKACTRSTALIIMFAINLLTMAAQIPGEERQDRAKEYRPQYEVRGKSLAELKILPHSADLNASSTNAVQGAVQSDEVIETVSGRVLIAFQEGVLESEKQSVISRISPSLRLDREAASPFFDVIHIDQNGPAVNDAIAQLRTDPRVRLAEPDYVVYALDNLPNDPNFLYLWGLRNIGQGTYNPTTCTMCSKLGADISAVKAWDITTGSANAIVAVIDTGVDYNHPDLAANILRDNSNKVVGYDFVNKDDDPMDDFGHGTHCAGTIGAVGNNGIGIAGVAWNVKIMPVKFLNASGSGLTSDAVLAVDFAVAHGAQVLSNSWGGGGSSQLLLEAIKRAEKAGVLFVAAAGNSAASIDSGGAYPANYNQNTSNVISVAATDGYDVLASFSNYGPKTCDIAAPGSMIYSTLPSGNCPICSSSGYGYLSGTSMASPHVSGAAALILSQFPGLSLTGLKARLLYSADHPTEMDGYTRWGRLNVFKAMQSDTIPPGAPSSFAVTKASGTGLRLAWTASGDDGGSGAASAYQIYYNTTSDITSAMMVDPGMKPAPSGTTETFDLTGLLPQTAYYVFLRAVDKVGNTSPLVYADPVRTNEVAFSDGAEATSIFTTQYGNEWSVDSGTAHSGQHSYASSASASATQSSSMQMINSIRITGPSYIKFWAKTDLADGEYLFSYILNSDTNRLYSSTTITGISSWVQYRLDLSAYVGSAIKLVFSLSTNGTSSNVSHRVWIDDLSVVQLTKYWEDNVEGSPQFSGLSPWSITSESSASPTHAWSDSPYSSYANNVRLPLMQNSSVSLPDNLGAPSLVFKAKADLEPSRDYLQIYASQDDGASWEYISALNGTSNWTNYSFDLHGWKKVRAMFFLVSNEAITRDGVYLDDIGVWGEPFTPAKAAAVSEVNLNLPAQGIAGTSSLGPFGNLSVGYATLSANTAPYGTAVYNYTKDGVVVFEAGVPATPPTGAARFFVDARKNVNAGSGNTGVRIDTGLAAVNSTRSAAHLNLKLLDADGKELSQGTLLLNPGEHIGKFLYQLAPDFVMPSNFADGLGSMEITSDQPVSIVALRVITNQKGDFLISNSPAADLSVPASSATMSLPEIVDGGGYQSTLILLNTSNTPESGTLRLYDDTGAALSVRIVGGSSVSSQYPYSIKPGGFFRLVTDGSPVNPNVGWAQVIPESGSSTPSASAILGLTQRGVLVTEGGFGAVVATTHARVYVDMSNGHDTAVAISNPGGSALHFNATAFYADGGTLAGTGSSAFDLPAMGHSGRFAKELVSGLPAGFVGVLDISSAAPFAAMTMRSLVNSAGSFLMTVFSMADFNASPPSPIIFPQIADGGGYLTQIILLSTISASSAVTVRYLDDHGAPMSIGK